MELRVKWNKLYSAKNAQPIVDNIIAISLYLLY